MVGYVLTAAWIVMVVVKTDGDMEHPLFEESLNESMIPLPIGRVMFFTAFGLV